MSIQNFKDLNAWKESHKLVLMVYKMTANFPKSEDFALTNQARRCVVSISSNIAEGFSRQGNKEKIQFYHMSKGSLTELENQTIISKDLGYMTDLEYNQFLFQIENVGRLLTGLIRSIKSR